MAENLFKSLQDKAVRLGERAVSGLTKGDEKADEALLTALHSVRGGRRALDEHRTRLLGAVGLATRGDLDRVSRKLGQLQKRMSRVLEAVR